MTKAELKQVLSNARFNPSTAEGFAAKIFLENFLLSFPENAVDAFQVISRFFRIRSWLTKPGAEPTIDAVLDQLKATKQLMLSVSNALADYEKTVADMLREVFYPTKSMQHAPPISANNELNELDVKIRPPTNNNPYALVTGLHLSSLKPLYELTGKKRDIKFTLNLPIMFVAVLFSDEAWIAALAKDDPTLLEQEYSWDSLLHLSKDTPLRYAVAKKQEKSITALLTAGANPNAASAHTGRTALMCAVNDPVFIKGVAALVKSEKLNVLQHGKLTDYNQTAWSMLMKDSELDGRTQCMVYLLQHESLYANNSVVDEKLTYEDDGQRRQIIDFAKSQAVDDLIVFLVKTNRMDVNHALAWAYNHYRQHLAFTFATLGKIKYTIKMIQDLISQNNVSLLQEALKNEAVKAIINEKHNNYVCMRNNNFGHDYTALGYAVARGADKMIPMLLDAGGTGGGHNLVSICPSESTLNVLIDNMTEDQCRAVVSSASLQSWETAYGIKVLAHPKIPVDAVYAFYQHVDWGIIGENSKNLVRTRIMDAIKSTKKSAVPNALIVTTAHAFAKDQTDMGMMQCLADNKLLNIAQGFPLVIALKCNRPMTALLINHGAKVSDLDAYGNNVWHFVSAFQPRNEKFAQLEFLSKVAGTLFEQPNKAGKLPMESFIEAGWPDAIVWIIININIDLDRRYQGRTLVEIALVHNWWAVKEAIMSKMQKNVVSSEDVHSLEPKEPKKVVSSEDVHTSEPKNVVSREDFERLEQKVDKMLMMMDALMNKPSHSSSSSKMQLFLASTAPDSSTLQTKVRRQSDPKH